MDSPQSNIDFIAADEDDDFVSCCYDEGADDDFLSEWDEDCEIVTETETIPLINLFSDIFVLNFT